MHDTLGYHWTKSFKAVYDRAVGAYEAGKRGADDLFESPDQDFLRTIGCTPQELYDFVEDGIKWGEPDYETCLLVTAVRRDYFLVVQGGNWTGHVTPMATLPAKNAAIEGIVWLPRIIEKAKIKLRGEMEPDLMYGCGGDRHFLSRFDIHLADFLRHVWAAEDDTQKIIDYVKRAAADNEVVI